MTKEELQRTILEGIPENLPDHPGIDPSQKHAPKRPLLLSPKELELALHNALRYFKPKWHEILAPEFLEEYYNYGRIYMYRFRPTHPMKAYPFDWYPGKSVQARAIQLMYQNNLDDQAPVAQFPHELITYGGNGTVFQNWAQYRLTMQYLATMTDSQTLPLYSGHPLGLFPSHKNAPRVVISNGLMIPKYSTKKEYNRLAAMGNTMYGQMTAGSAMYIGSQGIVHGTTITLMNAARKYLGLSPEENLGGKLFVTSGLGGMSGAQAKASVICGAVAVIAEIDPDVIRKCQDQKWLNIVTSNLDEVVDLARIARSQRQAISIGYQGNIVDLWGHLYQKGIKIDLGSDQTSLHNPYEGGYYPCEYTLEEANELMTADPEKFKDAVHGSLRRQVALINQHCDRGMHFWDYGNNFLQMASIAGADIAGGDSKYRYPSYVEHLMGPICFDHGFGPFRWVCLSGKKEDLALTDAIAANVLEKMYINAEPEIEQQLKDNLEWVQAAMQNKLVIGSQARILYANAEGRNLIAQKFNEAVANGNICAPIVIGRDHHDTGGTDSPERETANISDGTKITADMATQNVIGDAFRGATWVSIHNGGGIGWGEVINGGFGLVLDGSQRAGHNAKQMIFWDVNNGVARRAWGRNKGAISAIKTEMFKHQNLRVTMPNLADPEYISTLVKSKS